MALLFVAIGIAGGVYYFLMHKKLMPGVGASTDGSSIISDTTARSPLKSGTSIPDSDSVSEDSSEKIAYLFNRVRTSLENLNKASPAAADAAAPAANQQ